ncbi:MAG: hypothetical protein A2Y07_04255 [Planctomycetes bacterium GWF2_50_10]|nr:MAG: hypothetical protein A2Y07_04255 [Planctomycetes bacterium GWF2_50_10]
MRLALMIAAVVFCLPFCGHAQDANTAADSNIAADRLARAPQLRIVLPDPNMLGTISVENSIAVYDQTRAYLTTPLSDEQVSQLTWAANMTIRALARIQTTRAAPPTRARPGQASAPNPLLFPYDLYVFNVNGIFTYDPLAHSLTRIVTRDFRLGLSNAANKQPAINQAGMTILILTRPEGKTATTRSRFNEYAQAGQIAQSVALQAAGLGLGSLITTTFDQILVRKLANIPAAQDPIAMVTIGVPSTAITAQPTQARPQPTAQTVALILPEKNYSDEELSDILDAFDIANIRAEIASTTLGPREGINLGQATATVTIADLDLQQYDALIFIGGNGMMDYYRNDAVLDLIATASNQGKIIGGIGEGAALLAKAGILPADRARSYQRQSQYRLGNNQSYAESGVQTQAGIITAAGPASSTLFARAIIQAIRPGTTAPIGPDVLRPSPRVRLGGGTTSPRGSNY